MELQQYESSLTLSPPLATSRTAAHCALFIAGFATFINLYATQPLLPEFRRIFSASELMVSLTVSAPVLAVMLVAPLVGLMADAVGRKRVIVAAILGLAVPTALTAMAANLYQLIIWRFLQGLFVPGIIAVAMAYISEESPRQFRGLHHGNLCDRYGCRRVFGTFRYGHRCASLGLASLLCCSWCAHSRRGRCDMADYAEG